MALPKTSVGVSYAWLTDAGKKAQEKQTLASAPVSDSTITLAEQTPSLPGFQKELTNTSVPESGTVLTIGTVPIVSPAREHLEAIVEHTPSMPTVSTTLTVSTVPEVVEGLNLAKAASALAPMVPNVSTVPTISTVPEVVERVEFTEAASKPIQAMPTVSTVPIVGTVSKTSMLRRVPGNAVSKPFRAASVQDGHTQSEQTLYRALWDAGIPEEGGEFKTVFGGYRALAAQLRLAVSTVRLCVEALIEKQALEVLREADPNTRTPKSYKIYSYKAVLDRRRKAGLEWVYRNRQGTFLGPDPATISAVPTIGTVSKVSTVPRIRTDRKVGTVHRAEGQHSILIKKTESDKGTPPSSSSAVSDYLRNVTGEEPDDDGVHQLVETCRTKWPDITDTDIVALIDRKLRTRPPIRSSMIGFLTTAIPKMRWQSLSCPESGAGNPADPEIP